MKGSPCIVAGGGAAGYFAAIACAEANPSLGVTLYETSDRPLAKVRISGGGRCNVTHACFDPRQLTESYPRGSRELLGPFHRWQPRDTVDWFESRGVALKTEEDGRMFPVTDDSATVVDCLRTAAERAGVIVRLSAGVKEAKHQADGRAFGLRLTNGESVDCQRLLLATGGGKSSAGFAIAQSFGHRVAPPVPSLFTFHTEDPRLKGLEGLSVPDAEATIKDSPFSARGPMLLTHWGVSGPAILKLSAWGARELAAWDYRFTLQVSWLGGRNAAQVSNDFAQARQTYPRRQVGSWSPLGVPVRLWARLVSAAGIGPDAVWASVPRAHFDVLTEQLLKGEFAVAGKSLNKEEFVTCGGVRLAEVDFKTMQSKLCPGLYFAGEVLDIDGLTGGFNFQAAWTTGRLAGLAMAEP